MGARALGAGGAIGGAIGKLVISIGALGATRGAVVVGATGAAMTGGGSDGGEISSAAGGAAATVPVDSGGIVRAKNNATAAMARAASASACTSEKDRSPSASGRSVRESERPDRVSRVPAFKFDGGSGQGTRGSGNVFSSSAISVAAEDGHGTGGRTLGCDGRYDGRVRSSSSEPNGCKGIELLDIRVLSAP
jgi:hypothetical protein